MSRSYKHTPAFSNCKDKFYKRLANKRLRQKKLIHSLKHNAYKKDTDSFDICDYSSIIGPSFNRYFQKKISQWYRWQHRGWGDELYPDYARCLNDYKKWYIRK